MCGRYTAQLEPGSVIERRVKHLYLIGNTFHRRLDVRVGFRGHEQRPGTFHRNDAVLGRSRAPHPGLSMAEELAAFTPPRGGRENIQS